MKMPRTRTVLTALALLTLGADTAQAQRRLGGRAPTQEPAKLPWAPISIGARIGTDTNINGTVLGAQLRIPVTREGLIEIMPSTDMTSVRSLREYEFNLEGVVNLGRRRGGLYAGGGLAWRNTIFDTSDPLVGRETKSGVSAVVGLKTAPIGGSFGIQIEHRWVFVDHVLKPRALTFGVNFPLWGRGRRRPGG